jgi:hypothetical protein
VGVCAAIDGSTAELVPVLGVAEAPVPEGFRFPVGRLVPLDPLDDPLLPLDPLELEDDDFGFAFTGKDKDGLAFTSGVLSASACAHTPTLRLVDMLLGTETVIATSFS